MFKITAKQIEDIKYVINIQGDNGNWNYDPYMHGMYNGMELIFAIMEGRDPEYKDAPDEWLCDKPTSEHKTERSDRKLANKNIERKQ